MGIPHFSITDARNPKKHPVTFRNENLNTTNRNEKGEHILFLLMSHIQPKNYSLNLNFHSKIRNSYFKSSQS